MSFHTRFLDCGAGGVKLRVYVLAGIYAIRVCADTVQHRGAGFQSLHKRVMGVPPVRYFVGVVRGLQWMDTKVAQSFPLP